MTNDIQTLATFHRRHRYTARSPRHEIIGGVLVLIAQDDDDSWKYKIGQGGIWGRPFATFDAACEHASAAISEAQS